MTRIIIIKTVEDVRFFFFFSHVGYALYAASSNRCCIDLEAIKMFWL